MYYSVEPELTFVVNSHLVNPLATVTQISVAEDLNLIQLPVWIYISPKLVH